VKKFAEMLLNPERDGNSDLVPILCDLVTNSGKITRKKWSDTSKSLFAFMLDYGGPALAKQIRERIGGPSLTTLYKTVGLPYSIPQKL